MKILDKKMIESICANTISIMKQLTETFELMDTLYDIEEDDTLMFERDTLDELDVALEVFKTKLTDDIFSNTSISSLFDTPSVSAFVGNTSKKINQYQQASITARVLATSAIITISKVTEYVQNIYFYFTNNPTPEYEEIISEMSATNTSTIDFFFEPDMIEFAKESPAYGKTFLEYNNISVRDESQEDEALDDTPNANHKEDNGIRSTLNVIEFNADNLLNSEGVDDNNGQY